MIEKQVAELFNIDTNYINKLLGTNFKIIELLKTNFKFDEERKYNCDILFKADNKNYILEVDGVFWHGLLNEE